MPCPNGTTPPRISATMPSETRPLPAAIVTRYVSHFGANSPPIASTANATIPAHSVRERERDVGAAVAAGVTTADIAMSAC